MLYRSRNQSDRLFEKDGPVVEDNVSSLSKNGDSCIMSDNPVLRCSPSSVSNEDTSNMSTSATPTTLLSNYNNFPYYNSCVSNSSIGSTHSIPIPRKPFVSIRGISFTSQDDAEASNDDGDANLLRNDLRYTSSTWNMYHRITNHREEEAARKVSPVALMKTTTSVAANPPHISSFSTFSVASIPMDTVPVNIQGYENNIYHDDYNNESGNYDDEIENNANDNRSETGMDIFDLEI